MRRILALTLMTMLPAGCSPADAPAPRLTYPKAATGPVVDDYGGTKVPDPYRWMESLDSKEVAEWVAASNAVTDAYLQALPLRQSFVSRLTALWNYPRVGLPYVVDSGALFYSRNSGLQRQAPVYRRASLSAEPSIVLDPNVISEDGSVSVGQWSPSPDGSLLAYGLAEGGADWRTVKVRNVATGQDLSDEVRWMRFSDTSWTKDGKGFFYSRYPEPPRNKVLEAALANHALYYHRVGTPQSQDVLVYERKDLPEWIINGSGVRGRPLPLRADVPGRRQQEPALLRRPRATRRRPNVKAPVHAIDESGDAEYSAVRHERVHRVRPHRQERTQSGGDDPGAGHPGQAGVEDHRPRAQGGDRERGLHRRPRHRAVPRRRAEPVVDVRARRRGARRHRAAGHGYCGRRERARRRP